MNTITIEIDKHSDEWINWDEIDETEIEISEAYKQEVRSRIKKKEEHPEIRLTWEEIETMIRL